LGLEDVLAVTAPALDTGGVAVDDREDDVGELALAAAAPRFHFATDDRLTPVLRQDVFFHGARRVAMPGRQGKPDGADC
jgi:hypothetical protein